MTNSDQIESQQSAQECVPTCDASHPLQQVITRILKSFKKDIFGIIQLGDDGVIRSLIADRRVLCAEALSSEQIEAFLSRFPRDSRNKMDIASADGTKTPKEKWFHPDEGILPTRLAPEHIEKHMDEEQKERLRKLVRENKWIVDASGILDQ